MTTAARGIGAARRGLVLFAPSFFVSGVHSPSSPHLRSTSTHCFFVGVNVRAMARAAITTASPFALQR